MTVFKFSFFGENLACVISYILISDEKSTPLQNKLSE